MNIKWIHVFPTVKANNCTDVAQRTVDEFSAALPVLCSLREEPGDPLCFSEHGDTLWSRSRISRCHDCVSVKRRTNDKFTSKQRPNSRQ